MTPFDKHRAAPREKKPKGGVALRENKKKRTTVPEWNEWHHPFPLWL
jgi:hypothetical protein